MARSRVGGWAAAAAVVALVAGTAAGAPGDEREAVRARLAAERARQVERLREYREKGEFPAGVAAGTFAEEDPHRAEGRVHAFLAPNGALCALAHLIAASGRRDLVDRVAREQNDLCVAVTRDPEVLAWVRGSGLTLEECVRIQEPGFEPDLDVEPRGQVEEPVRVDVVAFLRGHLAAVEAELRRDAEKSLALAVERYVASR